MMNKLSWAMIFLVMLFQVSPLKASSMATTQSLSFGTLIPTTTSGSVSISTAGVLNTGGNVSIAPSGTGYYNGIVTFTPTLLGVVNFSTVGSSTTLTNNRPGGGTVTINNFVLNPSGLTIAVLGAVNIKVGATMNFTSASKGGTYSGTINVQSTGILGLGGASTVLPITLTLWNSLNISETTQLNFGVIERITGNSVIRINPQTGARTVTSGASGVSLSNGSPIAAAGQFSVSGEPNVNVSISLPSSTTLSGSNGGSMTVNNFTGYPSSTLTSLNSSGNLTLGVGADLTVGANQTSGVYTGTYTLTVNY